MLAYLKYAHGRNGVDQVWLSRAELRRVTGMSLNALNRAVRGLEDLGWLVVVDPATQHHSTRYRLAPPSTDTDLSSASRAPLRDVSSAREDASSAREDASSASRAPESLRITKESSNPPPPVPKGSASVDANGGREPHEHGPNATRALHALVADRSLPFTVEQLLDLAYTAGAGDPWVGYMYRIKPATEQSFDGARDPLAVLRRRLGAA
jgi:hypothetical protein